MMHQLALAAALPPLSGHQLLTVTADPLPVAVLAAALALYLWGAARNNRLHPRHRWPVRRTGAFAGGIVATAIALLSVVGVYDDELFWDHMVQHLLLIMVAAGLFAISSPIELAWRATSGRAHRWLGKVLRSRIATFVGHPLTGFIAYAIAIPLTHLTIFMTWVIQNPVAHHAEHVMFLVVGFFFWRSILGEDPRKFRLHPAMKALYLFLAVPVDTFVGLTLSLEQREIFPAEATFHRTWGPSLLTSLHWGGYIMWVGGDLLMMVGFVPVIVQWVRLEERRSRAVDREIPTDVLPLQPTGGQPTAGFALGSYRGARGRGRRGAHDDAGRHRAHARGDPQQR